MIFFLMNSYIGQKGTKKGAKKEPKRGQKGTQKRDKKGPKRGQPKKDRGQKGTKKGPKRAIFGRGELSGRLSSTR